MSSFAIRRGLALAFVGALPVSGVPVLSQQQTTPAQMTRAAPASSAKNRQKIGLVFEGGGALGFAHIGVIQWMEEHHIPVDYVAGTSMGGLVGGLYASGMSPDEIKAFVKSIDWPIVLSGQVPFPALSYRRKEDKLAYPNRLEFGLIHGVSLPSALNSGAAVGLLFDRVMLPYWDLRNFDDLPIPFRCVATELNTGQPHVFEDGSLSQALRATMAIPGMFAPVHHDNDVYSDGGAVDNLPVDVARAMGAQVVISSYLNVGPVHPDVLNSLTGVVGRNVSIMVAANEINSLKNSDVVVSSDVSKIGTLDFEKNEQIVPLGYKAAELEGSELKKYALNDADWAAYMAERKARRRTDVPVPQFLEVYGVGGMQQTDINARFQKYTGKPVDPAALEKSIADLQGTGLYSTINYNLTERDGKVGLLIRPRNKTWGPPFMNLGFPILANNANDVSLGIGVRATFFNVAGPGSEVRLEGTLGQPAGLNAELFRPLKAGSRAFVAPRAYLSRQINPYYEGSQQLEQYRENRNGLGVDLGYLFNTRTELRVGEDVQWYNTHRTIGTGGLQEFSLIPFVSRVRFQYLGQNDVMVPTAGSVVSTTYNYFTKRPNEGGGLSQMSGRLEHFIPIKSKGVIVTQVLGGTSFGASNLGLAGLTLGGPLRLSAYSRNELLGTDYFVGQVGYLHLLARLNPIFADSIYAVGLYEIGKMYGGNAQTPHTPNDVAAAIVIKTLIGPVTGGLSIGDSDHRRWFFSVGRVF
ncbi:MAG TPA: patatin-like phospholipase family protein [Edaphobacter sp.]|nr:patatin-like phospholipase family protein [Edaphobacter sp.]